MHWGLNISGAASSLSLPNCKPCLTVRSTNQLCPPHSCLDVVHLGGTGDAVFQEMLGGPKLPQMGYHEQWSSHQGQLIVGGWIIGPQRCQCPNPMNVTLHRKRYCSDMFRLGILRWEIILDFPGGPSVITRTLTRGRQEGWSQKERRTCDDRWKGEKEAIFRMQRWAQKRQWPLETGKGKEPVSPLEPPEGTGPVDILTLAQWHWFWTSDLQNHMIINSCCSKLLCLWQFVAAAMGN